MWCEWVGRSRPGILLLVSLLDAKWEQMQAQGLDKDLQVEEESGKEPPVS